MKKTLIASALAGHLGGCFGPSFRVYRDKPDDNGDAAVFGGDTNWGHTTAVEGDNLVGLGLNDEDVFDLAADPDARQLGLDNGGESTVKPDIEEDEEEFDEEGEIIPKKKKEEEEEEVEEEEVEEEEELDDEGNPVKKEEEEEVEEETTSVKADERTPSQKRVDSTFKALRLAEKAYRAADASNAEPVDPNKLSPELVAQRDVLIRERATLDPVANPEDSTRLADIDIKLEDIRTRIITAAGRAENTRTNAFQNAERNADAAINAALAGIKASYTALDDEAEGSNEKAIRFFNMSQKGYMEDGLPVADALEKALAEVVEVFSLKAKGAAKKLSPKEIVKKEEEVARNGVKKRLDVVAKKPIRGGKSTKATDSSLAELVRADMSKPEVQKALSDKLGIRFDK